VDDLNRCGSDGRSDLDADEMAIERAMAGDDPPPLRPHEARIVVARLTEQGLSAHLIAERLQISSRTVCRLRNAARQHAA